MEKKITTRVTALTAALAVIAGSAASCGKKSESNSKKPTAKQLMAASYRATEIDTDVDFDNVLAMKKIDDNTILISTNGNEDKHVVLYKTDNDFSSFDKIDIDLGLEKEKNVEITSVPSYDGKVIAVVKFSDYGDMDVPDLSSKDSFDSDIDYEKLQENLTVNYKMYCVDIESKKVESSCDIEELSSGKGEDSVYVNQIVPGADGKVLLTYYADEQKAVVVDDKGKIEKDINTDDFEWSSSFTGLPDGRIAVTGQIDEKAVIRLLDNKTFETVGDDIKIESNDLDSIRGVMIGTGDNKFIAGGSSGLWGITEDGKANEILNWVDSDLSDGDIDTTVAVGDDEFVVWYYDYMSDNGGKFYRLSKRDASELENTKVITVGVLYNNWIVSQKVAEFNKKSTDVRFKIEDYTKYDEYDDETYTMISSGVGQLKNDIISGKAPDMIVSDNTSLVHTLGNKGLFVDLYELMKNDPDLKKEDIMENVLSAGEVNGKLYSLAPSFYVSTLMCKKKYVDTPDWTIDKMIETYDSLPKGMRLTDVDCKEGMIGMLINTLSSCIDYTTGTCSFDTPEFRKLVEFCDKFPSEDDVVDWDDDSAQELYAADNIIKDKVLLSDVYLSDFESYIREIRGTFNNEPATLVGYPSMDGNGGILSISQNYSILTNSVDKEACWNLIKECFKPSQDDEESSYGYMGEFPSLKSEFEKLADKSMEIPEYKDENGKVVKEKLKYTVDDKEIELEPLTKEERDAIVEYIKKTDKTSYDFDPEVQQILIEELMAYLKGEKTANEVIDLLTSRISLLVSEQS